MRQIEAYLIIMQNETDLAMRQIKAGFKHETENW